MSGYNGKLRDGSEIYVPHWPASVSLENLTRAGQYLGTDNLIRISELNIPSVIVAIMESKEPAQLAGLMKHFVCQARVDGSKVSPGDFDTLFTGNLDKATEIFAHVVHAQYHDFFVSGLAKETSPDN